METTYIGSATVPNGYFGETTTCYIVFDKSSGNSMEIYPFGHIGSVIPPCVDEVEALWMIKNHPMGCRRYKMN